MKRIQIHQSKMWLGFFSVILPLAALTLFSADLQAISLRITRLLMAGVWLVVFAACIMPLGLLLGKLVHDVESQVLTSQTNLRIVRKTATGLSLGGILFALIYTLFVLSLFLNWWLSGHPG